MSVQEDRNADYMYAASELHREDKRYFQMHFEKFWVSMTISLKFVLKSLLNNNPGYGFR